ncbi:MAG: hypothetical protein AAF471_02705 [Myxococcota bacterium]
MSDRDETCEFAAVIVTRFVQTVHPTILRIPKSGSTIRLIP